MTNPSKLELFPKPAQPAETIPMLNCTRMLDWHMADRPELPEILNYERRRIITEMAPIWQAILLAGRPVMVTAHFDVSPAEWGGVRNVVRVGEDRNSQESITEAMRICQEAGYMVRPFMPYVDLAVDKTALRRLAEKLGYHIKRKRRK